MRYAYPVILEPQPEGGYTVTFVDLPGATEGDTEAEALANAADALITALSGYVEEGKPLPCPSAASGRPLVTVTALEAAKLALHDAIVDTGTSNIALARQLGVSETAVRRLRNPFHRSHIGSVEAALQVLGQRLVVEAAKVA